MKEKFLRFREILLGIKNEESQMKENQTINKPVHKFDYEYLNPSDFNVDIQLTDEDIRELRSGTVAIMEYLAERGAGEVEPAK